MATSLRPMSFQESSTTFSSGSAGLTSALFLLWAWTGRAKVVASRVRRRNDSFLIDSSTRVGAAYCTRDEFVEEGRGRQPPPGGHRVPTVGRISRFSTVAFGGSRIASTTARATVSGDIIFLRGARGQSVFQ